MSQHKAVDGATYTEGDIERWAKEAEEGFHGWQFGKPILGRPVSIGEDAKPFTLRLDAERRLKLKALAKEQGVSESQVIRDLIDRM